jgi:hypothetical protein
MPSSGDVGEWPEIDFSRDPRLLVGRRQAKARLVAQQLQLGEDVFDELAAICRPALDFVRQMPRRHYDPFTEVERGEEYVALDISDLPTRPVPSARQRGEQAATIPTVTDDTADLVKLVRSVDGLDDLESSGMVAKGFTFYAICWPHESSFVGFVSKSNPMLTLRPGFRYFRYGDVLIHSERPDVMLTESVDIVIGTELMAVLNPAALNNLLADVRIAFAAVPRDLAEIESDLADLIPLTPEALESVRSESLRLLSFARRLRELHGRLGSITLDSARLKKAMRRHDVDPAVLLDKQGHFHFSPAHVGLFLDVIEGRYFEDDLSGEHRRADRYSRRRSSPSPSGPT